MKGVKRDVEKYVWALVALMLFALVVGCGPEGNADGDDEVDRIAIGGGTMGGAYYPISVGVAGAIMEGVEGLTADVVTTGGSIETASLVGTGELDMGIVTSRDIGENMANEDIKIMFGGLWGGAFHIAVSSDIDSIEELKGKHLSVGPEGNPSSEILSRVLEEYGFTFDDIRASYLPWDEGISSLMDGQVDGAIVLGAAPMSAVQEMAATPNYKILSIDEDIVEKLLEKYPIYDKGEIPAGTYERQDNNVTTLSTPNLMIVNANLSEDLVYGMVAAVFDNIKMVHDSHPAAKALQLEKAAVAKIVPFHPGAEKYFKEKGVLK